MILSFSSHLVCIESDPLISTPSQSPRDLARHSVCFLLVDYQQQEEIATMKTVLASRTVEIPDGSKLMN